MTTECKGKQTLPYLLSTTKTLARCQHYFYRFLDFKFNCRKHRAYYSVENARVNLTRQWHNIIIPNAIIAREVGKPATWEDAINALAYAMTSAKEVCAVLAWDALLKEEAALPKEQRVWCKYYRSFLYYGLGQAISKDGYVYQLPKDKMIKSTEYFNRNWKLLSHKNPIECWKSPWKALNGLVAEFDKDRSMRKLTVREITEKYNVSNTTTSMFKYWLRQWISEFVSGSEYLIDDAPIFWAKPDEPEKPATPDEDFLEDAVETSETDHFNQLMFDMNYDANKAIKSGSRPVAKDQEEFELPF